MKDNTIFGYGISLLSSHSTTLIHSILQNGARPLLAAESEPEDTS